MQISIMKLIAVFLTIMIVIISCRANNTENKTASDTISIVKEKAGVTIDSSLKYSQNDSSFLGAYQGIFPCPDCDGIQQTIIFSNDSSYEEEQMYWGKNEIPMRNKGSWEKTGNVIELTQKNKVITYLIEQNDTLFATNINGIKLINSSKYFLIKRMLANSNPAWQEKKKNGIDFAAMGNEPPWNLEIDNKKSISFKLENWKYPVVSKIKKPIITSDSTLYELQTDSTTWSIIIYPQFCNDGINNYLYQNKVSVNYNGINYQGCGISLSK